MGRNTTLAHMNLALPKENHRNLKILAAKTSTTMVEIIRRALREYVPKLERKLAEKRDG